MHNYAPQLAILYTSLILVGIGLPVDAGIGPSVGAAGGGSLVCFTNSKRNLTRVTDCEAAINMIPSGILQLDFIRYGDIEKPISLEMDHDGGRNLRIPAAFIAGSCVVLTRAARGRFHHYQGTQARQPLPQPPEKAATVMYHQFWPDVKAGAERIVRECMIAQPEDPNLPRKDGGILHTKIVLGGWELQYDVSVGDLPDGLPKPGQAATGWIAGYNIYEGGKIIWKKNPPLSAARDTSGGITII